MHVEETGSVYFVIVIGVMCTCNHFMPLWRRTLPMMVVSKEDEMSFLL